MSKNRSNIVKVALFVILNVVCFYGLKEYNDTRQVRLVKTLLPSVVKVSPIQPVYFSLRFQDRVILRLRIGFGPAGHGSGAIISKDGLIVTCNHVVADTPLAEISLKGENPSFRPGKHYQIEGKVLAYVVGRDVERDVALLRLVKPIPGLRPVPIGNSVRKGLEVLTIGYPGPLHKYVTGGVISGSVAGNIFSDVVIAPGNSGGGVFDNNGRLVGLARAMTGPYPIPTYQGFSVLTSLQAIRTLVEKYKGF